MAGADDRSWPTTPGTPDSGYPLGWELLSWVPQWVDEQP